MLVLDIRGYDVILGMTWLSRYHAVIDCQNKKVIFRYRISLNSNLRKNISLPREKHSRYVLLLRLRRMKYQFGMSS